MTKRVSEYAVSDAVRAVEECTDKAEQFELQQDLIDVQSGRILYLESTIRILQTRVATLIEMQHV